jgi:hypothetical protein
VEEINWVGGWGKTEFGKKDEFVKVKGIGSDEKKYNIDAVDKIQSIYEKKNKLDTCLRFSMDICNRHR